MQKLGKLTATITICALTLVAVDSYSNESTENNVSVENKTAKVMTAETGKEAKDLEAKLTQVNVLKGKFEQELFDRDGASLQKTEGDFQLKRPGLFYWSVLPPYEQLVVSNEESLTVYDPDLEQATVYKSESLTNTPAMLLSGDLSQSLNQYNVSQLEATKSGDSQFKLLPKLSAAGDASNTHFDHVLLAFDDQTITRLVFVDKLGQTTDIRFHSVTPNGALDLTLFEFVPPKGTDVLVNE